MNKSVEYLLIIGFFSCINLNYAGNKATISACSRFCAENAKNLPAYQDHSYESLINEAFPGSLSPIQIARPQPKRSVHFARQLFVSIYKFSSEVKATGHKLYLSNAEYSAMLKLILFPFHVFW